MKIIILFGFALLIANISKSQNYEIDTYNGQTVTTCSGFFYDSGGASFNYGDNESYTVTFHSNNGISSHIQVYFHQFYIESYDTLYIYDGPSVTSPLIGAYTFNSLNYYPVKASLNNSIGDLTFRFISNSSSNYIGWKGEISCFTPCQLIFAELDSLLTLPTPDTSNYINICRGDSVTFVCKGKYLQNNMNYHQSDSTSTFYWDFGDGTTATGQTVQHAYNQASGYAISLTITDNHGCVSTNFPDIGVRVSGNPIGVIHQIPTLCSVNDSAIIDIGYDSSSVITLEHFTATLNSFEEFDSILFIPDGPVCGVLCYNTPVTFTSFAPNATVQNANDILSICVNMEHSFSGDLEFTLTCPNGQSSILKQYINNGYAYMGTPYGGINHGSYDNGCNPANNPAGTPWEYCWSELYSNVGTMNSLSSQAQLDSTHVSTNSGYYYPDQSFSNFIGCPLNGTWNLKVCDNWPQDNGYIFDWSLSLDSSLLPSDSYDVLIDSISWNGPFISQQNDSTIIVAPDSGGNFNYSVTVFDAFGCSYDTTFTINVINTPTVDLGIDQALCDNGSSNITLDAGNTGATSYFWNTNPPATTQTIVVNSSGDYIVTVVNTDGTTSCTDIDTVHVDAYLQPQVNLGQDTCTASGIVLDAGSGINYSYLWNTGATTQTLNVSASGIYCVEVASSQYCSKSDTINVKVIPSPTLDLGSDISICASQTIVLNADQDANSSDYTYFWIPGGPGGNTYSFQSNDLLGTFPVFVTKTGCTSVTDSIYVAIILCDLQIPNVFTPNGDNSNRVFEIKGLENYPGTQVLIFDRWGKKVYENTNYQNDWNGGNCSDGVYYYIIVLSNKTQINGTVTILR